MKVSILIPCHNQAHLLKYAVDSCLWQSYSNIEIIILDDGSKDGIAASEFDGKDKKIRFLRSPEPSGTGGSFNKAMQYATGDIVIFLCSDDVFTDKDVVKDIVNILDNRPDVVHVSRYYYQFIHGDIYKTPVRAWRTNDVIELANNPSGLAFRKSAIKDAKLSNKMFIEASSFVSDVLTRGDYVILTWDTVAVRIHNSISQNKNYYLKRWVSSPVEEWTKVGGEAIQKDFTSLIQIKNNFKLSAVIQECINFIKYRPANLLDIGFWFFATVSILTPRFILRHIPHIYRVLIGKRITGRVCRP